MTLCLVLQLPVKLGFPALVSLSLFLCLSLCFDFVPRICLLFLFPCALVPLWGSASFPTLKWVPSFTCAVPASSTTSPNLLPWPTRKIRSFSIGKYVPFFIQDCCQHLGLRARHRIHSTGCSFWMTDAGVSLYLLFITSILCFVYVTYLVVRVLYC